MAATCDNCGELAATTCDRDYGMAHCDPCHEAQLDYGFEHGREAFACDVCGVVDRRHVADESGDVRCRDCGDLDPQ